MSFVKNLSQPENVPQPERSNIFLILSSVLLIGVLLFLVIVKLILVYFKRVLYQAKKKIDFTIPLTNKYEEKKNKLSEEYLKNGIDILNESQKMDVCNDKLQSLHQAFNIITKAKKMTNNDNIKINTYKSRALVGFEIFKYHFETQLTDNYYDLESKLQTLKQILTKVFKDLNKCHKLGDSLIDYKILDQIGTLSTEILMIFFKLIDRLEPSQKFKYLSMAFESIGKLDYLKAQLNYYKANLCFLIAKTRFKEYDQDSFYFGLAYIDDAKKICQLCRNFLDGYTLKIEPVYLINSDKINNLIIEVNDLFNAYQAVKLMKEASESISSLEKEKDLNKIVKTSILTLKYYKDAFDLVCRNDDFLLIQAHILAEFSYIYSKFLKSTDTAYNYYMKSKEILEKLDNEDRLKNEDWFKKIKECHTFIIRRKQALEDFKRENSEFEKECNEIFKNTSLSDENILMDFLWKNYEPKVNQNLIEHISPLFSHRKIYTSAICIYHPDANKEELYGKKWYLTCLHINECLIESYLGKLNAGIQDERWKLH
ncbi:unnamed protein product [Brachionus calyciflorus]|uniref:Uncharacterized protein n=1 Tax=Brachionus calyciflorus TaxID=104777 RepID=A0A813TGW5_9BILA|nr:unnamed protein product [Brachionus calyciflorus]